jgi:signal transduction histidine kinase
MNNAQPKKILIVGDCSEDRKSYQHSLNQDFEYTYTFLQAKTAQEALALCHETDCMLLNLAFLDINVIEFLNNLREQSEHTTVPVILIIEQGNESIAVPAIKSGAQDYLIKENITSYKIIHAVHNAIKKVDTQRQLSEKTAQLSKANREREHALRSKDEFLAMVNHELRTPLSAILGMSELLEDKIYGPLNQKQLKCIRTIRESGTHLLELISNLLDLTQMGAGRLELKISTVSVQGVCQASLGLVQQNLKNKRLKISSNYDYNVETLLADEYRLIQILTHLLSNAVKFTPEGGTIGLEVLGDEAQNMVHFTVWDTGIGIAKDKIEELFQPFFQQDSRLTREYEGMGLGLSLVHHLTMKHDGNISVESEEGKGSRFIVSLPWLPNKTPLTVEETSAIAVCDDSYSKNLLFGVIGNAN